MITDFKQVMRDRSHQKTLFDDSGYVYATVRLATAIINYRFKSRTDTSTVMDMDAHLVRRSYERTLLMKQFSRTDTDQQRYQNFIESFLNRILDYRKEQSWKPVPIDQCQDFLKFPKVINTQTASTPNNIRNDLHKNEL